MNKTIFSLMIIAFLGSGCSNAQEQQTTRNSETNMSTTMNKSEEEWRKALTPEQYHVLREKGTERPFTGKFVDHKEKGVYTCAGCGNELFSSEGKYDTHCGWPSFFESLDKTKITTKRDVSHGMERIEIMCANCGGHLGHIFDDGPQPTGQRYCVNSVSLDFKKDK